MSGFDEQGGDGTSGAPPPDAPHWGAAGPSHWVTPPPPPVQWGSPPPPPPPTAWGNSGGYGGPPPPNWGQPPAQWPPHRSNRNTIVLAVALGVIVVGALLIGTPHHKATQWSSPFGQHYGDRTVARGGPAVPPTTPRTGDDLVRALDPDGSRRLRTQPLEDSTSNQVDSTGTAEGYQNGIVVERGDGSYRASIETFDTAAHAEAFNQEDTRRIMDEHTTIDRRGAPVAGATAFVCGCGNGWVAYTRGNIRVLVYVSNESNDPPGEADRAASIIDQYLQHSTAP